MARDERAERDHPNWLQVALGSIGDAVIVTDADGRVVFMNPVAEALTGWPAGDAAGQPLASVFRIVSEQTRQPPADPVARVLATGLALGLANHTILVARDGTERPIDDSAAPVRDGAGATLGVVLVFRDIGERRRAEMVAEESCTLAAGIVETVREPLLVLDADLRVRTANRSFYRTFGVSPQQTEGQLLYELGNRQWDIPRLRELLDDILPHDSTLTDFVVDHEFAGLGHRSMVLNARRLDLDGGRAGLVLLAVEDATDRLAAAHSLEVSETRYRRLFETAQDGILILDAASRRVFDANPFLTDLLGYSRDELVGKELWEIGLFRDIESNKAAFRTLQEQGYIRYEDLPLRTKDGRRIEVEFVSNVYPVDNALVIQCNIRDVTDRKRAEDALRAARVHLEWGVRDRTAELRRSPEGLTAEIARRESAEADRRELLRRLATAQEDERRHLARELHDQMGQHLAALGLGLKALETGGPDSPPAQARLRQLLDLTDLIGRELHHLALELRPTALDDLGLRTALAHYAERWSERSGVAVDFEAAGLEAGRLPAPAETALYRVVQEALTNVLKHAQARRVSVVLQRSDGRAQAVVEDDGHGFDVEAVMAPAGDGVRLGLLGMRERLALVGGTLAVESTPGRGTTVIARVPLDARGEGGNA
jgi:PAS domain S-box-containing protein